MLLWTNPLLSPLSCARGEMSSQEEFKAFSVGTQVWELSYGPLITFVNDLFFPIKFLFSTWMNIQGKECTWEVFYAYLMRCVRTLTCRGTCEVVRGQLAAVDTLLPVTSCFVSPSQLLWNRIWWRQKERTQYNVICDTGLYQSWAGVY